MNLFNITILSLSILKQFEYFMKYRQSNTKLTGPSPWYIALTAIWTAYNFCSSRCLPNEIIISCKNWLLANSLSNFFSGTHDYLILSSTRRSLVVFNHLIFEFSFVLSFISFSSLLYMRISFPFPGAIFHCMLN